ncbi:MAG: methionine gamma-lyase family protein [Firmicutes bacterium]|nr:methionine gamma-lyase family protein [Bacillota bacterium]
MSSRNQDALQRAWQIEEQIRAPLAQIERLVDLNQAKVLQAFTSAQVSESHLHGSTGYGYNDRGREQLQVVYAKAFGAEDALVSPLIVSGTHALTIAYFALLRPGQRLLSITGDPYDTLFPVIGLAKDGMGSLREFGIGFTSISLLPSGGIDLPSLRKALADTTVSVVAIQRSAGYAYRRGLSVAEIADAITLIKTMRPDVRVVVDNCYGEFTELQEPSEVGADLTVGSLIKNPGGGLAPTGAYLVGTAEAVAAASYRLTAPGLGREAGSYENYRLFYQGLFMAPHTVGEALKGNLLSAAMLADAGIESAPAVGEPRVDLVLRIKLESAERLIAFCQAIQAASPIDAHARPEPDALPGYESPVIMAAGAFVQGSSIELSADGPIREPYVAYLQGGLTFSHVKWAMAHAISALSRT